MNVAMPFDARALQTELRTREMLRRRYRPDPWFGPAGKAREGQRPPDGEWRTWLIVAGRGWGKTATGAQWVRREVMERRACRVALVGSTAADVRDVMVEGVSGLLAACRSVGFGAEYQPSRRRVLFEGGSVATLYSAEEPDRLRGPQHDLAWSDELAAWADFDTWDQLQFGLRMGTSPRQVVTTTPRAVPLLKLLIADAATAMTRGTTYENRDNLPPSFLAQIVARYEGTRLGRAELLGELLDDVPGALWSLDVIDRFRLASDADLPPFTRIVVAIDPQAGYDPEGEHSETGIVVAGRDRAGHGYVVRDLSGNMLPHEWARIAVDAYREHRADAIVIETNQGGKMASGTLKGVDGDVPIVEVHASRGKIARAEPVAALAAQGRIHHVGAFPQLEDQLTQYVPDTAVRSPDRLDAMVWALTELLVGKDDGLAVAGIPIPASLGAGDRPGWDWGGAGGERPWE